MPIHSLAHIQHNLGTRPNAIGLLRDSCFPGPLAKCRVAIPAAWNLDVLLNPRTCILRMVVRAHA